MRTKFTPRETKMVPHFPAWMKRFAKWLFALTHDDELGEVSFYVRYRLEYPTGVVISPAVVRQVREDRLRAMGALDVMTRLGLGGE